MTKAENILTRAYGILTAIPVGKVKSWQVYLKERGFSIFIGAGQRPKSAR
jgi:hypothetical protein